MQILKSEKAKRTTIAPKGMIEHDNYYVLGDRFVRIMTITSLPEKISEGFLTTIVSDPRYHIDMLVEPTELDVASTIQKEIKEMEQKIEKSTNLGDREILLRKYRTLESALKQMIANNSRTVNVVINLYLYADTLEELNTSTKEIREKFHSSLTNIKLYTPPKMQVGIMQKNSPLFIGSELNRYANYHMGLLLPTLTASALWPFIFDSIDDRYGTFIGVEATSGGKIVFDQFAYLNDPNARFAGRTAGNMIVMGVTGMGKTTFMNNLVFSHLANRRKIIWCDPENKNERLTKIIGGSYIEFGADNSVINIFDLKPISTDSDDVERDEVKYDSSIAIGNVVEDIGITFRLLWPETTEDELNMLNEITVRTYRMVGIEPGVSFKHLHYDDYPTFTVFSAVVDDMIDDYSSNVSKYRKEYDALRSIQMKMRSLVGSPDIPGHLARYFNGITNIDMESFSTIGLVSFGTKHLSPTSANVKNALLRILFNYAWSNCLSSDEETVFITDEDHTYMDVEEIASIKAQFQRRARKYRTVTISGTQQVSDYIKSNIITHGKAIFDNSTYQVYFQLRKGEINDLSKIIHLTDQERNQIEHLVPYTCIFNMGMKKMAVRVLSTDDELHLYQ